MNNKIFLTESEKNRILGMHQNAIINENKNLVIEADLKQIQQLLVDKGIMAKTKPNGKDAVDGLVGPITLDAIYNALSQTGGASGSSGVSGTQGTSGVAGTQGTSGVAGTQGTSGVAGTQGTSGVSAPDAKLATIPANQMQVQSNASNQPLKPTGDLRTGREIKKDYNQQQRGARKDRRQIEKELKDLQSTFAQRQNMMTDNDKLAYQQKINQLQIDLGGHNRNHTWEQKLLD